MRLKAMSVLPALAVVAGMVALPASSASADATGISLPFTSFSQIAVDSAHDHLLFLQPDSVVVTDFTGKQVGAISGLSGLDNMLLSPDSSTLYVVDSGDSVIAYSTTTLSETASYLLPADDKPLSLALQSGRLWVGYDDSSIATDKNGAIGDFDLSASSPSFAADAVPGTWLGAPSLYADSSDSGTIAILGSETTPGATGAETYDTASGTPIAQVSSLLPDNEGVGFGGAAIIPGGKQIAISAFPGGVGLYSTSDLSQAATYASNGPFPTYPSVDSAGAVAMGQSGTNESPNLSVFLPGTTSAPVNAYTIKDSALTTVDGLAWSADGSQLFAVTENHAASGSTYELNVFDNAGLIGSGVGLVAPATAALGSSISLSGSLYFTPYSQGSQAAPAGVPITVTRTLESSAAAPVTFNVQTNADGNYALTDTPPAYGTYTYTASYAGDATHAPTSYSQTVQVNRQTTSLSLSTSASTVGYNGKVTATATLGNTDTNRSMSIYETPAGGAERLLGTGTVNSSGQFTVTVTTPVTTTFTASFSGDSEYSPATAAKTVGVGAQVQEAIKGYYGSQTLSEFYELYHRTGTLEVHTTVTPGKPGECVKFEFQHNNGKAWVPLTLTGCAALDSTSKFVITRAMSGFTVGGKYRIRVDFLPSAKDTANLAADSGWLYFIDEK